MGAHTPFTPSAVHEGLFDSQLACYLLPVLRLLFPPRQKPLLLSSLLGGKESCDLRPRALEPDSDTPHGLPLWASTHNARREVHARMARGGRDTMDRHDAAGKDDVVCMVV